MAITLHSPFGTIDLGVGLSDAAIDAGLARRKLQEPRKKLFRLFIVPLFTASHCQIDNDLGIGRIATERFIQHLERLVTIVGFPSMSGEFVKSDRLEVIHSLGMFRLLRLRLAAIWACHGKELVASR
jgi:hypothetical protein